MEKYLRETNFIDYSSPIVQDVIAELDLDGLDDIEKAKKLFYYVRDATKYSIKGVSLNPDTFKASFTLKQNSSYCIPKALALCTLARSVGIPSRIHLVDFINHRLTPELQNLWGTNLMASHAFTEMYLNNRWVKATPALDKKTCSDHKFRLVEFDGINDGMLQPTDINNNPHVEYVNDHGTFDDLPLDVIMNIFKENYGNMSSGFIEKLFSTNINTFN